MSFPRESAGRRGVAHARPARSPSPRGSTPDGVAPRRRRPRHPLGSPRRPATRKRATRDTKSRYLLTSIARKGFRRLLERMIALKAESRNRGGRRIRADAIRSRQEAVTEPTCLAHATAAYGRKWISFTDLPWSLIGCSSRARMPFRASTRGWQVFVSRSVFVSRTARRPGRASTRIRRGGRGDSLCDGAAETRRRAARRAAPRRTRFCEENHGKDASATAAGGSGRSIPASVKKVSGRFRDA